MASEEQEMKLKISQLAGKLPRLFALLPHLSDSSSQVKSIDTRTASHQITKRGMRHSRRPPTPTEVCYRSWRPLNAPLTGTQTMPKDGDPTEADMLQEATCGEGDHLQFTEIDRLF